MSSEDLLELFVSVKQELQDRANTSLGLPCREKIVLTNDEQQMIKDRKICSIILSIRKRTGCSLQAAVGMRNLHILCDAVQKLVYKS
jgi:hypothetical protein